MLPGEGIRTYQLEIGPREPASAATWRSSNEAVATVNQGFVTAVSAGTTVVSVTFEGLTFECVVVVSDGITISADGKTLMKVSTQCSGELVIPSGVALLVWSQSRGYFNCIGLISLSLGERSM